MASSCPPHEIDPSARKRAMDSKSGATVKCKKCGKSLRLKASGESIKDEARVVESLLRRGAWRHLADEEDIGRDVLEEAAFGFGTFAGESELALQGRVLTEAELSSKSRNELPDEAFALPGRRYPIHDEEHARNALSRVAQNGSEDEQKKVKAAVHKKFPSIGGESSK